MDQPKRSETRPDVYEARSNRRGVAGVLENGLRQFKTIIHAAMLMPLYAIACLAVGVALMPGISLLRYVVSQTHDLPVFAKFWLWGATAACAYVLYGFSIIIVAPTLNFLLRAKLKPWRGPYYSLDSIRWYVHNGTTYLVRYTFLEFLTPTPFNILFFKLMGMKIGRGTVINSSHISDPSMIVMGKKVTIGGSVTIVAHYGQGGFLVLAPVIIGDGATIGLRATIMGGAEIGPGAKILPNSVVMPKTRIPAGETWGGVPAQKISVPETAVHAA